jgi:hypothetical protein
MLEVTKVPSIEFLFEHSEPFIKVLGDKGYQRFCDAVFDSLKRDENEFFMDELTYDEADKIIAEVLLEKFITFEDGEIKENAPGISKMLLWHFVDMERKGKAPEKVKEWVLDCLEKISKGDDATEVFKLKRSKRGSPKKFNPLDLRVACKFELLRRAGETFESAQFECHEEFGISERAVARIIKRTALPPNTSDLLLETYSRVDATSFFKP